MQIAEAIGTIGNIIIGIFAVALIAVLGVFILGAPAFLANEVIKESKDKDLLAPFKSSSSKLRKPGS